MMQFNDYTIETFDFSRHHYQVYFNEKTDEFNNGALNNLLSQCKVYKDHTKGNGYGSIVRIITPDSIFPNFYGDLELLTNLTELNILKIDCRSLRPGYRNTDVFNWELGKDFYKLTSLERLTIRTCGPLHILPEIKNFTNLKLFEIYEHKNTTNFDDSSLPIELVMMNIPCVHIYSYYFNRLYNDLVSSNEQISTSKGAHKSNIKH